jgi:hypothetical protein
VFKFSKISTSHGVIKKGEEVDHLDKVHMEMMIKNQGIGRSWFMMASSSSSLEYLRKLDNYGVVKEWL